jgi:hypothetical protein
MKRLDANYSCIEISIRLQKISQRLRRNIPAARNRDMRMPWTKLHLQAGGERGFMHALMDLKQMRVRLANADPNNFWSAFRRESSDPDDGQKKRAELDCIEFLPQHRIAVLWNIAEESECQVHLVRISPAYAADMRIKICEQLARCVGQIDGDEKASRHGFASFVW